MNLPNVCVLPFEIQQKECLIFLFRRDSFSSHLLVHARPDAKGWLALFFITKYYFLLKLKGISDEYLYPWHVCHAASIPLHHALETIALLSEGYQLHLTCLFGRTLQM